MLERRKKKVIPRFLLHPLQNSKYILMVSLDFLLLPFALWLTFALQYSAWFPDELRDRAWIMLLLPLLAFPIFMRFGLYRAVLIYIGSKAFFAMVMATTLHTVVVVGLLFAAGAYHLPASLFAIYWLVTLTLVGGSRMMLRGYLLWRGKLDHHATNVVIYGAGEAGAQLVEALQIGVHHRPVALIDDNPELHGTEIQGVRIYGPRELPVVIAKSDVDEVLLALPSITFEKRRRIMDFLEKLQVRVRTVPDLEDIVAGRARIDHLQEITMEDILGRDPVAPDQRLLTSCITGKSVMVTGAGGSIGSELCRQIVKLRPQRLVLFELSEFNLYTIDADLRRLCADGSGGDCKIEIVPLLGSVTNERKMDLVMRTFAVQTIYHAAAYKHVPLVEYNPIEGVNNNVIGTYRVAQAAARAGAERFVFISTDKAVRPTNVMGATKRMAELVVQAVAEEAAGRCRYCIVRFGNVLDSSGSVVPLFRQQIRDGGPVTLTHPQMTRYFMTIPEAAQLVIQAGALCREQGVDTFILDMGKPVAIQKLARRMIALSGYSVKDEDHPHGDITIETTQIRPGEKLYEELSIDDNVAVTEHRRIFRAVECAIPLQEITAILGELQQACDKFDNDRVRNLLLQTVTGYQPQCGIEDKIWIYTRKLQGAQPPSATRH